jgi:uncharacterized protein YrrD
MRTAGELVGLAVVGAATGERLGRLQDVLFEPGSGRVTAFRVRRAGGGLFSRPQLLLRERVQSVGQDAVLVGEGVGNASGGLGAAAGEGEPLATLVPVTQDPPVPGSVAAHGLDGRVVLDAAGHLAGRVADVLLDDAAGSVSALLLSAGFVGDLLHGRPRTLPLSLVRAIGADSVVAEAGYDPKAAATHPPD